jgi:acylphosphatase
MKALKIQVFGRVQGVFYRASTKAVADQIGIKGFVKNLKDGSVLIEAEGEDFFMQDFLDWCKYGPDDAKVDETIVEEIEVKNHQNFNILKK